MILSRMVKMALALVLTTMIVVLTTVSFTLPMEDLQQIRIFVKALVATIGVVALLGQLFILGDLVWTYKNGKENDSKEKNDKSVSDGKEKTDKSFCQS